MHKIEAMEGRVKPLHEDITTCISEMQWADLTINGLRLLVVGRNCLP
jgi:hypothetical protein